MTQRVSMNQIKRSPDNASEANFLEEFVSLIGKLGVVQEKVATGVSEGEELKAEMQVIKAFLVDIQNEIREVSEVMAGTYATKDEVAVIESSLSTLTESVEGLSQSVLAMESRLGTLETEKTTMTENISALTTEVETIKTTIEEYDERLTALENPAPPAE